MKKLLTVYIAMIMMISPAYAQNWQNAMLPNAQETMLLSQYTQHPYRIQITKIGQQPTEGYPVLYILDGDALFPIASTLAQTLWQDPNMKTSPSLLVVGIGYSADKLLDLKARAQDFTPKPCEPNNMTESQKFGGADKFAQFIDQELIPMLNQTVAINPNKQAIFGHSYGGLWLTYQLMRTPQRYQYYFISSPSIWWDNRRVLDFLPQQKCANCSQQFVRISVGGLEVAQAHDARRLERAMIPNAKNLNAALHNLNIKSDFVLHEQETHGSVMFKALQDNLKFLHIQWQ